MFSPIKLAVTAFALCAVSAAAQAAQTAAVIYARPSDSLKVSGAPIIVESRVLPTSEAQVVFTQGIDFARTGTLSHDLDLATPDPDHRLPAGTELYARETATGTEWCTIHLVSRNTICLYAQDNGWIWQQNDTRLPVRCYFILPCLLAPPKIDPILHFPAGTPQIDDSTPAAPRFVEQVTLARSGDSSIEMTARCKAAKPDVDDRTVQRICYYPLSARPDLFRDRILVGGDNTGARLHYDASDGSIMVTKVALDPITSKTTP